MAETSRLLICRTGHTVPRVRIPPSPPFLFPFRLFTFLIGWTALLMSLSGCQTSIRFLYNQSDWLVERWANQLLEFRGDRRAELHREVQGFFKEHRSVELPLLVYYLHSTADLISRSQPTEARIQNSLNDLENLTQRTLSLAIPGTARILASLSPAETERLKKNIETKNSHLLKEREELSLEDWQKQRRKNSQRAFKFLAGTPSPEQEKLIEQWILESDYSKRNLWLSFRQIKQAELFKLLERKAPESEIKNFLRSWIEPKQESLQTQSDYSKHFKAERQRITKTILALSLSLSPKQKEHFVETLHELSDSLKTP